MIDVLDLDQMLTTTMDFPRQSLLVLLVQEIPGIGYSGGISVHEEIKEQFNGVQ